MSSAILTTYGYLTHWWAALPAIPSSQHEIDWWAAPMAGRTTRYERLRRVWSDQTRFQRPKEDPDRPHEFAKPKHGTHLICKFWENFGLFAPGIWIPELLRMVGINAALET